MDAGTCYWCMGEKGADCTECVDAPFSGDELNAFLRMERNRGAEKETFPHIGDEMLGVILKNYPQMVQRELLVAVEDELARRRHVRIR